MSALCCCVPRRKDKQDAEPPTQHTHVEYHQEPTQPIPAATPQDIPVKSGRDAGKEVQAKEIPYGTPAQLDELIVEDDDEDTGGEEAQPHLTRRASAALGAVRARFIRHLSSESDVKRQSTASVGKSHEEIARRAELRRLRHKRIQDELQDDLDKAERKEELNAERTTEQANSSSIKSIRDASLTSPSQSQPGGGPRDTIEFVVLDGNQVSPKSRSPAPSLVSKTSIVQKTRLSRQSSGIESQPTQQDCSVQRNKVTEAARQARNEPSEATSLPLPHSDTRSTFRLSSSPSWLDRIIGVDNAFSESAEHPSLDGHSALSVWLAAQGLRSRDNSMARLNHDESKAGDDHENASKNVKHSDEISISASELSRQSGCSKSNSQRSRNISPMRKTPFAPSHGGPPGHVPERTSTTDQGPQQIAKSPSEDLALDYAAALAFTSPNDSTSSQYASRAQSFLPSPSRSRPNLHHLDTHDLKDMQLSPFQWHGNRSVQREIGTSEARSSYATAQDHLSTSDLPIKSSPRDHAIDSDAADAASFSPSETASFQIREAELQTIEKRFAGILSHQQPAPFNSRFKEEFGDASEPAKKRPSLIPRMIHLRAPGKVKHPSKSNVSSYVERLSARSCEPSVMGKPNDSHCQQKSSSSGQRASQSLSWNEAFSPPSLKESATDLWQRALRQEAEQRRGTSSKSALSSRPSPSHSRNSLKPKENETVHSQAQAPTPGSGQYLEVPKIIRTTSQSKWRLPRWATPGNQKTEPVHEVWPKLPMDLAAAPESWARYSSHDREQRNAHAKSEDRVKSQDFAIRSVSSDGNLGWTTDKDAGLDENIVNRRSVSMHGKLGRVVKSGITKLLPFTEKEARSNSLGRRRGSFQLAGEVEYPELEVLPPGIGHILEPEQVADAMSSRRRSRMGSSYHSFDRHSLSKAVEHRPSATSFRHLYRRASRSTPLEISLAAKSVEVLPTTPLKVLRHGDKHSTPRTEVFVTPLSTNRMEVANHDEHHRHSRLPIAKSEQALPFYKIHPGDGGESGWMRSFTWSGSLSAAQAPSDATRRGHHELQVLRRTDDLNASKDSFATGASFTTAVGE